MLVERKRKRKHKNKVTLKKSKIEANDDCRELSRKDVLSNIYNLNLKDSTVTGKKLLEWLIHPISVDDFMKYVFSNCV